MRFKEFVSQHWLNTTPWYFHVYRLPLMFFAILLVFGHWLGAWMSVPHPATMILATLLVTIPLLAVLHFSDRRALAGVLFIIASLLIGIAYRGLSTLPTSDSLSQISSGEWEPCAMQVEIVSPAVWQPNPNYREGVANSEKWKTKWNVRCLTIRNGREWQAIIARSFLSIDGRIDQYLPGDVVQIHGHMRRITPPTNPGGFDFAEHSQHDGVFTMLRCESAMQLSRIDSHWGLTSLARLRGLAIRAIDKSLTKFVVLDQAPLAAALVFGQRQQVDWEDQQELMATGTLHMLAISGLHVQIIAGMLLALCSWLKTGKRTTFIGVVFVTWCYAGLSGAQPPVIRAAVQVTAFAFASWIGGRARLANMLGAAAIVLFLMRSTNLMEVGVQLSFLAVGTIGLFMSETRRAERRGRLQAVIDETLPAWQLWLRSFGATVWTMARLSCWVALLTCPLIWSNFKVVSPIAVPLNVVVSIPLTVSLVSGLGVGLLGWIPPLGWLSGNICGASLTVITSMVMWGHRVPGGHYWLPAPSAWWVFSFYAIAIIWLLLFGRRRVYILGLLLFAWILFAIAPWMHGPRGQCEYLSQLSEYRMESTELRCTFLNVGHGTCVVLELPTGEVWLYDAGHMGAAERSYQDIAASLWYVRTARIDRLIISHADADHYNATLGLIERFEVGEVVSTPQFWRHMEPDVRQLIEQIESYGVGQTTWSYQNQPNIAEPVFQVLHPSNSWQSATDNANSLCLLIEYAGVRILLPGDLEGAGILQLLTLPARPCQVVMAPHHGSLTHDPTNLLEWCQPELVVISGGNKAVRPEVIERYSATPAHLAITHRDGAVQVRIGKDGSKSFWKWSLGQWQQF